MRRPILSLSAAALALTACFSGSDSGTDKGDPYAGLSCEEKIAAIGKEVQDTGPIEAPVAKATADSTVKAGPDTALPDTARRLVEVFRGYPPVSGLNPAPGPTRIGAIDSRPTEFVKTDSSPGIQWIPPVGFDSQAPGSGKVPDTAAPVPETTAPTILPKSISAVQIVSRTAYKARIRVHDFRDALVRELHQEFGYRGELDNPNRMTPVGLVSFLVWDNQDAEGRTVPTGVYLWHVSLEMESGETIEKTIKVGYIGEECRPAP